MKELCICVYSSVMLMPGRGQMPRVGVTLSVLLVVASTMYVDGLDVSFIALQISPVAMVI